MRRAAIALISAFLVLGPPARSAIAAADRLAITTVVANHQAGTLFTVHVEARDGSGVVDTGFTGDITLSAAASGGANFTTGNVVTAVAGVATCIA